MLISWFPHLTLYLEILLPILATEVILNLDADKYLTILFVYLEIISIVSSISTEETVVGVWYDGRPIYRKVYVFTKTEGQTAIQKLTEQNFDNIWLNGNSFMWANAQTSKPLNVYESAEYNIRTEINHEANSSTYQISVFGNNSSPYYNGKVFAIVEYTKTTDKGTEEENV